jgi:hypothetical protein
LESFLRIGLFEAGQRRGVHVSVPEIGSRDGLFCFGGIWGVYADLRRELNWRNLKLGFFGVVGVSPREVGEEGGALCALLGEFGGMFCVG